MMKKALQALRKNAKLQETLNEVSSQLRDAQAELAQAKCFMVAAGQSQFLQAAAAAGAPGYFQQGQAAAGGGPGYFQHGQGYYPPA